MGWVNVTLPTQVSPHCEKCSQQFKAGMECRPAFYNPTDRNTLTKEIFTILFFKGTVILCAEWINTSVTFTHPILYNSNLTSGPLAIFMSDDSYLNQIILESFKIPLPLPVSTHYTPIEHSIVCKTSDLLACMPY